MDYSKTEADILAAQIVAAFPSLTVTNRNGDQGNAQGRTLTISNGSNWCRATAGDKAWKAAETLAA